MVEAGVQGEHHMRISSLRRLRLPAAAFCLFCSTASHAALELLVPAYFDPGAGNQQEYWNAMTSAAAQAPLTAIANPNNGPGDQINSDYTEAIASLHAAGGKVVGYIYTGYGQRLPFLVHTDIDQWLDFYDVDGFFVDEMSSENSPNRIAYYGDLYDYIKSKGASLKVIGNPGINPETNYFAPRRTADVLTVFENPASTYPAYAPASWTLAYPASSFAHMVISESTQAAMLNDLTLAAQRNAGLVFVTSDGGSNPYDTLPPYWNDEVQAVVATQSSGGGNNGGNNNPPPTTQTGDDDSGGGAFAIWLPLLLALWRRRRAAA